MPRRPAALENLQSVADNNTFQITDTMTLIVRGEGGLEMRVRQNGTTHTPQGNSNSVTSTSTEEADNSFSDSAAADKISYEDLHIGAEIGRGSQGKVRVVQHHKTKVKYALKYIVLDSSSEGVRSVLEAELRQVFAVKHRNVVSSYEAFFRDGRVNIVLEYMDAGTMKDIMRRHPRGFSESMLAYIARELLGGLVCLHKLNIIHRDIKPANVLFNSKGEVKIADFGVAKTFSHEDMKTLSAQGSMPYMSPERIQQKPYSFPSDIWSVGLTIAECAIGEYPFISLKSRIFELCQALVNGTAKIEWNRAGKKFSPTFVTFVELCLLPCEKRPSAADLLTNAFIAKADEIDAGDAGSWFMQKQPK